MPSSSGSHSTVSPGARGLSDHGSVTPPFRHDREREIEVGVLNYHVVFHSAIILSLIDMSTIAHAHDTRSHDMRSHDLKSHDMKSHDMKSHEVMPNIVLQTHFTLSQQGLMSSSKMNTEMKSRGTRFSLIGIHRILIFLSLRVGDFSGRRSRRPHREAPLIVQDEYGRELYRCVICDNFYLTVLNIDI